MLRSRSPWAWPYNEKIMTSTEFEKLVRDFADRQEQEAAQTSARWQERKTWWIERVQSLFDQIDTWLRPLVDAGAVTPTRSKYPAHEEKLGTYDIDTLVLEVAGKKLTFLPKGTLLLGSSGRIDVSGPNGDVLLVLINADAPSPEESRAQATWYIRNPSRPPPKSRSELRPLNEATFQELFADLFGIPR
jgi:hypothetical protein